MTRKILIFLFPIILTGCSHSGPVAQHQVTQKVYDAMTVKAEQKPAEITLPAEIKPLESARIFARVNGYLNSNLADIGSVVKKGDLLALLDAPELKAQLAEAGFRKEAARAKYITSKDTWDRVHESSATPGVVSSDDAEKAKNQMLADSANYNASLYYLNSIQDLNNYLLITSPFNGIVTVRNMNPGDIVGSNASRPIFEVENTSVLRIRVAVPEAYTGNELVSKEVTFTVSAYPEISFTARFARKAGGIDVNTRTEIWEFETDNPDRRLKGGMYAEIRLKLKRSKPTVFIPRTALVTTLEKSFVIRVKDETTEWIDVTRGITAGDRLEVFGNLKDGDILLANANEEIKPGTRIKIRIQ